MDPTTIYPIQHVMAFLHAHSWAEPLALLLIKHAMNMTLVHEVHKRTCMCSLLTNAFQACQATIW
jgi:hypothetical protein